MSTRDIPFDEECHERPDAYREAFGDIALAADLQAMRLRWADIRDRARERLQAEHGKRREAVAQ